MHCTAERVKGKRVQIPHDLVTVIREPAARVLLHRSLGVYPGRRRWALIFQPGNLPAAGYGGKPQEVCSFKVSRARAKVFLATSGSVFIFLLL